MISYQIFLKGFFFSYSNVESWFYFFGGRDSTKPKYFLHYI